MCSLHFAIYLLIHDHLCCTCIYNVVGYQISEICVLIMQSTMQSLLLLQPFNGLFQVSTRYTTPHHNRFTALFPGPPWWAGARRELLDFMAPGEINRGRHTDTLTIRLCATPSRLTSAHLHHRPFLQAGCPSCRPTNSVKALKATSAFELGRRC